MKKQTKEWKPWEIYKQDSEVLDIKKPPCQWCRFWKPQRKYSHCGSYGITFNGIVCCHAKEMHSDFSCFKKREDKEI